MSSHPPRIGIDLDHEHDGKRWVYKVPTAYVQAIVGAGGQPVLIPSGDPRPPVAILADLDGLLMTGGDDVHPRIIGQEGASGLPMRLLTTEREGFVIDLAAAALRTGLPCLSVCLGCQAMNIAAGGDIWLDLEAQLPGALEHRNGSEHLVNPEPGGLLFRYWQGQPQTLKSHHHQAIRRLGSGLALEATAEDGVIEAIRCDGAGFQLGVQWHPEIQQQGPGGSALIDALVKAASSREHDARHRT